MSDFFTINNGVKQGAVLSTVLYCVYTNDLYHELRRSNIGCSVGQNYAGIVGYADDIFLLSPSLDGLQKMLRVCEMYAEKHNLKFSTDINPTKSKTKCMAFCSKERNLPKLTLCGNDLPWVGSGKHLGVKIVNKPANIIGQDIKEKRAQYIQRNNELAQEFSYANCVTKANINRIYNSHFTGSVLWNLASKEANMVYNTWSVSIRKMFRLDRTTHRYLIEPISKIQHIKISIMKRFSKFVERLSTSKKDVVRNVLHSMVKDCRSTTGTNIRLIRLTCGKTDVSHRDVQKLPFREIPEREKWRTGLVEELLRIRDNYDELKDWEKEDIDEALHYVCTT